MKISREMQAAFIDEMEKIAGILQNIGQPIVNTGRMVARVGKDLADVTRMGLQHPVQGLLAFAGHGQIENACCEACLTWLGRHGGQIQHIKARGAGGSRDPELGSPAGGAMLCGTPSSGCHGLCEARDEGMYAAGFWIKFGERLGAKPIRVGWRTGTWTARWLLADGTYGDEPAEREDRNLASKNFSAGDAA